MNNNQIINGGQHSKDLNYITEYVKDKNLSKDRKKLSTIHNKQPASNLQQKQIPQKQEQTVLSKNFNKENAGPTKRNEHTQHKNFTKSIYGINERKKRNSVDNNEAKYANRRNFTRNQYHQLPGSESTSSPLSYQQRSNSQSINGIHTYQHQQRQTLPYQYHQQHPPQPFNNANNNNNAVHTEIIEQPTLMELECVAGFDGGLPQYFFLEAYDSRTKKLRLNITSALNDIPLFRIDLAGNFHIFLSTFSPFSL